MANISYFQIRAKGDKNKVLFFAHTLPVCEDIEIIKEKESNKNYTIIFTGCTKWSLNSYADSSEDLKKINIDEYIDDDGKLLVDKAIYNTLEEKSKIWKLELDIFEEYEDYYPDDFGSKPLYKKVKNGIIKEENNYTLKEINYLLKDILKIKNLLNNTFEYAKNIDECYDEEFKNNIKIKRLNAKDIEYVWHEELIGSDNLNDLIDFMKSWVLYEGDTMYDIINEGNHIGINIKYNSECKKLALGFRDGSLSTSKEEISLAEKRFEKHNIFYIIISCQGELHMYPVCFTYNLGEGLKQKIIHNLDYEEKRDYSNYINYFDGYDEIVKLLSDLSDIEKDNLKKLFKR